MAHTVGGDWRKVPRDSLTGQACGELLGTGSWGRGCEERGFWFSWKQSVLAGGCGERTSSKMSSLLTLDPLRQQRTGTSAFHLLISRLTVPCHCQASSDAVEGMKELLKGADCGLAEELLPRLSVPTSECRSDSSGFCWCRRDSIRRVSVRVCVLQLMNFTNVY